MSLTHFTTPDESITLWFDHKGIIQGIKITEQVLHQDIELTEKNIIKLSMMGKKLSEAYQSDTPDPELKQMYKEHGYATFTDLEEHYAKIFSS